MRVCVLGLHLKSQIAFTLNRIAEVSLFRLISGGLHLGLASIGTLLR